MREERRGISAASYVDKTGVLAKVYDDLFHSGASEIGKAVGRAVALGLSPVSGILWTAEQAVEWVAREVTRRFEAKKTNADEIQPPAPALLGSVVVGLQQTGGDSELSSLFAELLCTAMIDPDRAHPAYASIIREILPQEARVLGALALVDLDSLRPALAVTRLLRTENGRASTEVITLPDSLGLDRTEPLNRVSSYTSNLLRVGLLGYNEIEYKTVIPSQKIFEFPQVVTQRSAGVLREHLNRAMPEHRQSSSEDPVIKIERSRVVVGSSPFRHLCRIGFYHLTDFGLDFMRACHGVEEA